jgi:hypothetical protein
VPVKVTREVDPDAIREAGLVLGKLKDALRADLARVMESMATSIAQWKRAGTPHPTAAEEGPLRDAIRAAFAVVDGRVYVVKRFSLEVLHELDRSLFTPAEVQALREEAARIKDTGKVKAAPSRPQFCPNVKFAFRSALAAAGAEDAEMFSGEGWREFEAAAALRDRLTHPRAPSHLVVTADDLSLVYGGLAWFLGAEEKVAAAQIRAHKAAEDRL